MPRLAFAVVSCAVLSACSGSSPPSPFVADAGTDRQREDAGDAPSEGSPFIDAKEEEDPTLGGPCLDDGQCDDGVDCTTDRCDLELSRCRFTPDPSVCQDSVFCDGEEICDPKLGCRDGDPVTCSDDLSCTIDTCVEATHECKHTGRDADGDGEAVWNCTGGTDCDDADPRIFSKAPEVCANGKDDDCDGSIDEGDCVAPAHDTCVDPLLIEGSGSFALALAGAHSDYSATCGGSGGQWRDAVVALNVPAGPDVDIDVSASVSSGSLSLASLGQCGDASTELACVTGVTPVPGGVLAKIRLRNLGPGVYPLYVFSTVDQDAALKVEYRSPEPKAENETCGTAQTITPGTHVTATLIDAAHDLDSACNGVTGELVYAFDLATARDVRVFAASLDGVGRPAVSLRGSACSTQADELTCSASQSPQLFARSLAAGGYFVAVAASAPTSIDLLVETFEPSTPPEDESCEGAPRLEPNRTLDVALSAHTDDVQFECMPGAVDAAYELELSAPSDVLLVERISSGDVGAVSLARPPCATASDLLDCGTSGLSPVRAVRHDLSPGSYRAIVESSQASPTQLTAFVRPSTPPTLVAFADSCQAAITIPPGGGFFQGNTANASADYDAGCDLGGESSLSAPEQVLKLSLPGPRRVVFDMKGSEYNTLLDVRQGPSCPGQELLYGCAAGYVQDRSYVDLVLPAGDYFVQVDGYAGDSGAWSLDVFVAEP